MDLKAACTEYEIQNIPFSLIWIDVLDVSVNDQLLWPIDLKANSNLMTFPIVIVCGLLNYGLVIFKRIVWIKFLYFELF